MDLREAVFRGRVEEVKRALEESADINAKDEDGRTALMHAVIDKNANIARLIVEAGANLDVQDSNGYSALHFASQEHAPEIVDILLSHGAKVDTRDAHGNTPLFRAVFNSRGRGEVIERLLRARADRNLPNKHGVSPLDLAKSIGNYDIVKFFP